MKAFLSVSFLAAVSPAIAFAENNRDVSDCEFFVDDFAVVNTGVYGSSSTDLVFNLKMRSDLDQQVVGVGGVFNVSGQYAQEQQDSNGTTTMARWSSNETLRVQGERNLDGRQLKVTFKKDWNTFARDIGAQTIHDFTLYVTVRQNGVATTFWLKENGRNLSSESISPARYNFSDSVFLGGYSTARYMWRDSGSPLFANRSQCVGR
jgi:hypothetical protein